MNKNKIKQASNTLNNDRFNTKRTKQLIKKMLGVLNEHRSDDIGDFFSDNFNWFGSFGYGTKIGLKEFHENWQISFQKAFTKKISIDEGRIFEGEWGAVFGRQEAVHTGYFMGISPTNKKVIIKYIDFWRVKNDKIINNG